MNESAELVTRVSVRVFGGTSVFADGPVSIGGPRQRRLLALLAVRAGSVVSIDWLGEHLWAEGERPEATAPALRTYMSRLRQSLPEEAQAWIETEPSGYRLSAPDEAVEHRRFAGLRAKATAARDTEDPQTALRLLDEALALWRGDPFRELEDLDWAQADIAQLELDRLEMLEERWEASLALGRHTQITGELAAFTAEHGLRDRAARQHALALHRSGRTAEALRVLDDHRRLLADESGLDPSPGVVELEAALLRGDASLEVEKVGRPLRGYRLLDQIGSGAFSVVWRGLQPSVGREVAIKQIRAELATQPEFIRRFEAEAHLVARIEHPHIVPLIDFWRDPDSAYLVMRQLKGGTLERLLDDGPLSVEQTLKLADQIGGALTAAHDLGVIHRDVKTANILCDEQGNTFLSDFGIALEATKSSGPEAALSPGSPAYASPEQIRRERLGPEADVFSLGVVLFECLTGSLPFASSASVDELIDLQLNTEYPSLAELRADVPGSVSAAVAKATSKTAADRFETVAEFVAALSAGTELGEPAKAVDAPSEDLVNPYKGLRAFDDGDQDHFYGRDRIIAELLARLGGELLSSRCLVVVGPSGSGKSSLVRAGLVPALRSGAIGGSEQWFTTTMVPGSNSFESLEAALLRVAVNPPPTLLDQLRDGSRGVLRSARRCLTSDQDVLLLVIDQFEELFTASSAEDAEAFLDALSTAVQDPSSPLRVVITLRADYYHRPLEHPAFAPILKETLVSLTPLAPDELEQAIVEPARRLGVEFEPGLLARVAAETLGQPSPLPLLQYALSELFDRRSGHQLMVAAYDDIGGLSGALAARAEALYEAANAAERTAARRVFGRLTRPVGHGTDLRHRVTVADLGSDPATTVVLERFGAARLLTFDRDIATREPTVEVAHEALLREWPRLANWLDEDRDVLRSAAAIGSAATTWHAGGRVATDLYRGGRLQTSLDVVQSSTDRLRPLDIEFIDASRDAAEAESAIEDTRVRRLRRLVVGVAAALVIAVIAGGVAVRQQRRADDQAEVAIASQELAEEQRNLALDASNEAELATLLSTSAALEDEDPTVATLLALEAHRRAQTAETEQVLFNALTSTASANRVATFAPLSSSSCPLGSLSSSGMSEFVNVDGVLLHRDLTTGEVTENGPSTQTCVSWMGDQALDQRLEWSFDVQTLWFSSSTGAPKVEKIFDAPMRLAKTSFRATHVLTFIQFEDGRPRLHLLDDRTGEAISQPVEGGDDYLGALDINTDGSLIAWATFSENRSAGDGQLAVIDGVTGDVLFEIDTPEAAARVAFDPAADELIVVLVDGTLQVIDLAAEAVVVDVPTELPARITELDVRADGAIVAVSAGQVALLDRQTGQIDQTVDLRFVENSRYRPDGSLLTVTSSDQIDVLSLEGNALVERTWNFPADGLGLANGFAAGAVGGTPVVLDLETGEQTELNLQDSNGAEFNADRIIGEAEGVVAINDRQVGRWEDGQLIEMVDLDAEIVGSALYRNMWLIGSERSDGTMKLDLVNVARGEMRIDYSLEMPALVIAGSPTPDGGMWITDEDGVLRTYDPAGVLLSTVQTELSSTAREGVRGIYYDPVSGRAAVLYQGNATATGGIVLLDLHTGETEQIVEGEYAAVGFARAGDLLVIVHLDGTVRLWDIEQRRSLGVAWNGTDTSSGAHVSFDETDDSIWVDVSDQLVNIPVTAERWVERACEIVGRDFTQDEWDRWVPGSQPLQSACQ